jgi:hypothetical protein
MCSRKCCDLPKEWASCMARMSLNIRALPLSVLSSTSRSAVTRRYCFSPARSAGINSSGGHGLVRKRKMWPWLTASRAVFWSAFPVNMIRTCPEPRLPSSVRNSMPFMPGICMSATTTAYGSRPRTMASAFAPPTAVSMTNSFLRLRWIPAKRFGSSSTNKISGHMKDSVLLQRLAPRLQTG